MKHYLHSTVAAETAWSMAHEGLSLVTMVTSFLLLARHLGTNTYGSYVGLYGLLAPFTAFTVSGVSMTVLEHTIREREEPGGVVRSCSTLALSLGAVLSMIVVGLASVLIGGIDLRTMALLVSAELVVNSSTYAMVASIQARFGFIAAVRVRIVGLAVRLAGLVALAVTGEMTLSNFALVYFASFVAYAAWVSITAHHSGHVGRRFGRAEGQHLRSTFLYGFGISAVNVQNDGDKVALNAFNHQHDAGVYGAAYRVVQMGLLPITALVSATHMSFLEIDQATTNQLQRAKRLASVSALYALVFAAGMLLGAPLLGHLLSSSFDEASHIMPWLVPLVVLRGPGTFAMNGLLGLGKNRLRTIILVSNAALSVVLYVSLIPHFSWRGAAAGTVISEFVMFCAGWTALVRCQHAYDRETTHAVVTVPPTFEEGTMP